MKIKIKEKYIHVALAALFISFVYVLLYSYINSIYRAHVWLLMLPMFAVIFVTGIIVVKVFPYVAKFFQDHFEIEK